MKKLYLMFLILILSLSFVSAGMLKKYDFDFAGGDDNNFTAVVSTSYTFITANNYAEGSFGDGDNMCGYNPLNITLPVDIILWWSMGHADNFIQIGLDHELDSHCTSEVDAMIWKVGKEDYFKLEENNVFQGQSDNPNQPAYSYTAAGAKNFDHFFNISISTDGHVLASYNNDLSNTVNLTISTTDIGGILYLGGRYYYDAVDNIEVWQYELEPSLTLNTDLETINDYNLTSLSFNYNGTLIDETTNVFNCSLNVNDLFIYSDLDINIENQQAMNYSFNYVDNTNYEFNVTCVNDELSDSFNYTINVDNKPHVYLFTNLVNNTINYNDPTLFIDYNGSVDENWQSILFTCDLYVDDVYDQVDTNINLSMSQNFTYTFGTISDDITFKVNCSNSETQNSTGNYIYSVDTISVSYDTTFINNSIKIVNESMDIYFNFTDNNLDGYEINITNLDNSSVVLNLLAEGILTTFAENLTTINNTALGNFSLTETRWDSHTTKELIDIPVQDKLSIIYRDMEFYCDNTEKMEYISEIDRIKPKITFKESLQYQSCYYKLNNPRKILTGKYKNHYIDRELGIWIDETNPLHTSEIIGNTVKVTYNTKGVTTLITESFGDLNVDQDIFYFQVLERVIPVIEDVRLDYNIPYDNETLYGYCNASHRDLLNLTYYWQVLKNDVIQNSDELYNVTQNVERNVFNISSTLTSINETWKLRCKVYDGTSNSSWYMTSVIIQAYNIVIEDYTPDILSFGIDENTNYTFSVDTISGGFGGYTFQWFVDSILQAITQAWTYVGSIGETGVKTITVLVNDTMGTGPENVTWTVNITQTYFQPTNATSLTPIKGNMDYTIPIQCGGSKPQSLDDDIIKYRIDYNVNGGSWSLLFNNTAGWGQFDLGTVEYGDEIDFRCLPYSSHLNTSWYNPEGNITRSKQLSLYLYDPSPLSYYIHNQEYQLGIVADTELYSNISISEAYVDCNGDYLWDYYWNYTDVNYVREHFTCVNYYGNVEHVIGITLLKDTSTIWNIKACDTTRQENECRIQKSYELRVI